MKYRRLNKEELEALKGSFTKFLAVNTVTADDWEKLKKDKSPKVESLIETFSDMVFERTLSEIKYLERKSPRVLQIFHCGPEKIEMVGLEIEGETNLDFTQNLPPQEMMQRLQASNAELKLFKAEKAFRKDRLQELFEMLESGCLISKDENLYQTLMGIQTE